MGSLTVPTPPTTQWASSWYLPGGVRAGTTSVPLQRPFGRSGKRLKATLSLEPFGWYHMRVINSFGVPLVATQPVPAP
jgi:hypothetical protein